ncbi:hypothetical protein SteCoe_14877 [Stentor coeruleus]|uniref:Uncharacterized protein n=1 Tax=Stentor coeruleus TaxID=5963 RepID=A0A1R2C4X8_9CILI|nr:hypothetical protein SteCoe_14877 [Stentor coeruleus]
MVDHEYNDYDFGCVYDDIDIPIQDFNDIQIPQSNFSQNTDSSFSSLSSLSLSQNSQNASTSSSRRAGRPEHDMTQILRKFTKNTGKSADRENFSIFIIRIINKLFRCALKMSKIGKTRVFKGIRATVLRNTIELFKDLAIMNIDLANACVNDKRHYFTTAEIKKFFSEIMIQSAFKHVIDVLFIEDNIEDYCIRFNFRCCGNQDEHRDECVERWMNLKGYLNEYFMGSFRSVSGKNDDNPDSYFS